MDWHHGFPPEDSLMMVPVSGRKEDVNSQGRYGLPVSCECFCRSVTAGRLPACVFAFDRFLTCLLGGAVPTSSVLLCRTVIGRGRDQCGKSSREDTRGLHPWVADVLRLSCFFGWLGSTIMHGA